MPQNNPNQSPKQNVTKDDPNEPENSIEQFIKGLEELIEKYDVKKYAGIFYVTEESIKSGKSILLHKANDIMEVTRILKMAHSNCKNEVARRIGESN